MSRLTSSVVVAWAGWLAACLFTTLRADSPQVAAALTPPQARATADLGMFAPSSECIACHRKDDKHRAKFGTDCASCHNSRAWAIWSFDHDRRSRFPLQGMHKRAACESCHTQPAPAGKALAAVGDQCAACHRRDDSHDGSFGTRCEQCHVSEGWKKLKQGGAAPPSRGWLQ